MSADADPDTGLAVYDSGIRRLANIGGTSLPPAVAAYYAITGAATASPQWAYAHARPLNDPVGGSNGAAPRSLHLHRRPGYDGPTGAGRSPARPSTGAPGIGGPPFTSSQGYAQYV